MSIKKLKLHRFAMKLSLSFSAALLLSLVNASKLGGEPVALPPLRVMPKPAETGEVVLEIGPAPNPGRFEVQTSEDLQNWQPLGEIELGPSERLEVVTPPGASAQAFYRLSSERATEDNHRSEDGNALSSQDDTPGVPTTKPTQQETLLPQGSNPVSSNSPSLELTYHVFEFDDAELRTLFERGMMKVISAQEAADLLKNAPKLRAPIARTQVVYYR